MRSKEQEGFFFFHTRFYSETVCGTTFLLPWCDAFPSEDGYHGGNLKRRDPRGVYWSFWDLICDGRRTKRTVQMHVCSAWYHTHIYTFTHAHTYIHTHSFLSQTHIHTHTHTHTHFVLSQTHTQACKHRHTHTHTSCKLTLDLWRWWPLSAPDKTA